MRVKGLGIYEMLNDVGLAVMDATHNRQQPWVSNSPIRGTVYLNPPDGQPPVTKVGRLVETPQRSLTLIQEAYEQLEINDYAGARATLTKAIDGDPSFSPAYSYRGFAWYVEGRAKDSESAIIAYRRAFPDLDKAIQLDPTYAPSRRHRGNTIIATYRALKSLGRPTNDPKSGSCPNMRLKSNENSSFR
jgi:tetratricopeptide (TPR) repeat protein